MPGPRSSTSLFSLALAVVMACSSGPPKPEPGAPAGGGSGSSIGGGMSGSGGGAAGGNATGGGSAAGGGSSSSGLTLGYHLVPGFDTNPGNLSMYLYVPHTLPAQHVPVVVALHGCLHPASSMEALGWDNLAEEMQFLVIYPETTANNGCFAWWDPMNARRDQGQALSIKQMIDYVKAKVDVGDVSITGPSSGAAMTAVMLAVYPDVFSAGAIMSGIPYGCANSELDVTGCMTLEQGWTGQKWADFIRQAAPAPAQMPRVSIWHGTADTSVIPAKAMENVEAWTNLHGLSSTPTTMRTVGPATYAQYADSSGIVKVEEWLISGMGHAVALDIAHGCGMADPFYADIGLCSTRYAAEFFLNKPGADALDGGAVWTCSQYYSSNVDHLTAGRAEWCQPTNGDACAVGALQNLGPMNILQMSWVKETGLGIYASGQCP
jgi:poly(hydroxyalkanoate) depolymerase family esterase